MNQPDICLADFFSSFFYCFVYKLVYFCTSKMNRFGFIRLARMPLLINKQTRSDEKQIL